MREASAGKLQFDLVTARGHDARQDMPPKMESIRDEILVDTDGPDRRLELLHDNVRKFGTAFYTVAPGTHLAGMLHRKTDLP